MVNQITDREQNNRVIFHSQNLPQLCNFEPMDRRNQYRKITIQLMLDQTRLNDPDYVQENSYHSQSLTEAIYSTYSALDHQTTNYDHQPDNYPTEPYIKKYDFDTFQIKLKPKPLLQTKHHQPNTVQSNQAFCQETDKKSSHNQIQEDKQNDVLQISTYMIASKDLTQSQLKLTQIKQKLTQQKGYNRQNKQEKQYENKWLGSQNKEQKQERRRKLSRLKKEFQNYNKLHGITDGKQVNIKECCQIM